MVAAVVVGVGLFTVPGARAATTVTQPAVPAAALASELRTSPLAERIGAPALWARGATGAGIVIGVLDSGVLASHVELRGRVLAGYDAATGGLDTGDATGHGTHVAALLAGARDGRGIAGVAPDAWLLPVRVLGGQGATDAVLSGGIRWAASRAAILNLSLASPGPIARDAIRDAVADGRLVVIAAGNRGAANPDWPARFARESWANGPAVRGAMIAVGAVDANNVIAASSNRAGDTAAWFLVAPGVNVTSAAASGDADYARLSGTSMAAPAVSGAAALLQSLWPRLTANEVASLLLVTARDLGARGTDPVYGRGLLDVEAALKPVGTLMTQGTNGTVSLAASALRLTPATVGLGQAMQRAGLEVVALDAYRRDFTADLGSRVTAPLPQQVNRAFDAMDRRLARTEQSMPGGVRLTMQPGDAFALSGRDAFGEFAFGAGAQAREWFGLAAGRDVAALANPFAALAPRGALMARAVSVSDTTFKAGLLGGSTTESSGLGWTQVEATTTLIEASHRVSDALAVSATWSRSVEQGAWLGAVGTGAFAAEGVVRTDAVQVGAAWTVVPGQVLAATWALGRTPAHRAGGVLERVSASTSDAASVAWLHTGAFVTNDTVSMSVSQPMRTRSGEAQAVLQVGVDADGAPGTASRSIGLAPSGRERVVEFAWQAPLSRVSAIGTALAVRMQPNHDAAAGVDTLVAVRYRRVY